MIAIVQGRFQPLLIKQLFEQPLSFDLRHGAQVVAVEVQQVEGVVLDAALPAARQRRLKFGEVGSAVLDDDRLAVYDGRLAWGIDALVIAANRLVQSGPLRV
jgi:hypothetical protein